MKTVKELREALEQFPDDMLVIMSSDQEGNDHSPWNVAESSIMHIYNPGMEHGFQDVDLIDPNDLEDLKTCEREYNPEEFDEEEFMKAFKPVVCLWP